MDELEEVTSSSGATLKRKACDENQPLFEPSNSQPFNRIGIDDAPNVIEIEEVRDLDDIAEQDTNGDKEKEAEVDDTQPFQRKAKKKTSDVWQHFTTVVLADGTKKNRCTHCKTLMAHMKTGCTTHLKNHNCSKKLQNVKNQQMLQFSANNVRNEEPVLTNGKYDHAKQRKATAIWMLVEEKPFNATEEEGYILMMKANLPLYQKIHRKQAKEDCFAVYNMEKENLKKLLLKIKKISLTTDLWTSKVQQKSYMCVTGHFIDKDWKLQKRVLNFFELPPPHGGVEICDALFVSMKEWGIEDKVYTVSVDNASSNNKALELLVNTMARDKNLMLEGKLFHVRCCAHIMNLIVQDGLSEIHSIIKNVRNSVRHINGATSRLDKFAAIVKNMKLPVKKLMIDVKTRWNSTYLMLDNAYGVRDAFPIYMEKDATFVTCPTKEDWKKVRQILEILAPFYEATQTISGHEYPTSNLFLIVVFNVKGVLERYARHSEDFVRTMVSKMQAKFDKYWEECNLVMAIGSILNPRRKVTSLEFAFDSLYSADKVAENISKVRQSLCELFNEYTMLNESERNVRRCSSNSSNRHQHASSLHTSSYGNDEDGSVMRLSCWSKFQNFVRDKQIVQPEKSELDIYLEEGTLVCDNPFDVLGWWKANELKYPILSRLACDMLAIPITTVASEATFSAGSRVLDPYRANLHPTTVEMLICGGDWLCKKFGITKRNSSLDKQPVVVKLVPEKEEEAIE